MTTDIFNLSFGGGLKWSREDRFMSEMGLSRRNFRKLCKRLGVPLLRIGRVRVVPFATFKIAMWAISRIGQKDFIVPGCIDLRRGERWLAGSVDTLDPEYVAREMKSILDELAMLARMDGVTLSKSTMEEARAAAAMMLKARDLFKDSTAAHKAYERGLKLVR